MSAMCCVLCVATGMLCYTNATTITYGGYVRLLQRQLELSSKFLMARIRSGPLSLVTAIFAILTVAHAIIGMISPEFSYFEPDSVDEKDD